MSKLVRAASPLLCLLLLWPAAALAQDRAAPAPSAPATDTARATTGVLDGAPWRIDIPVDWNGDLVVLMHGYEPVGVPRQDPPEQQADARVFLDNGYAVAASDYASQGWAVADGIADSERLRQHFVDTHGKPERTLAVGYSLGGYIALATLETHGAHYDGGYSLCGANAPAGELFADGIVMPLVAAQYFFPKAMGLADGGLVDPDSPPMLDGEALEAAFKQDEATATRLAQRLGLPRAGLADSLWLYYVILREAQQRAGGHPVDNTATVYSGFGDDEAFNRGVPRYAAVPAAAAYIERSFDLSGRLDKPVVLLSNAVDPTIPATLGNRYVALAEAAGNADRVTVLPPVGEGHCNFTDEQVQAGLDALDNWDGGN